jgi:hypothetical protein
MIDMVKDDSNRKQVLIRQPEWVVEQWDDHADDLDYTSRSAYIADMVNAGRRKIPRLDTAESEQTAELRDQRDQARTERDRARRRIEDLEERLDRDERAIIREYVHDAGDSEGAGAGFADVVQTVIDTAPARVSRHLDELVAAEVIEYDAESERWYTNPDSTSNAETAATSGSEPTS